MSPRAAARARYQPHPMLDMERRARDETARRTGKSWREWVKIARARPGDETKTKAWLVKEHGFAPMQASWLAWESRQEGPPDYGDPEPLVDALYAGTKESLRPLHEALVDACLALGDDVLVTACKTMVPVYRKHVFAEMRPAQGGVLLRLALGDVPHGGRLTEGKGMPGDRLTHAVLVGGKAEIDAPLEAWLGQAYENGSGALKRKASAAVPADLAKALKASRPAAATWDGMTPAMRRDMILWITSAKQAETRARRLERVADALGSGKRRVY